LPSSRNGKIIHPNIKGFFFAMFFPNNPILTDYFQYYELVIHGCRVSDHRLQRYEDDDEIFAFQLIRQLNVEEDQWWSLLGDVLHEAPNRNEIIGRRVAQL